MKAKSRLKGSNRYKTITGKYFYVRKGQREKTLLALIATIIAGLIISSFSDSSSSVSSDIVEQSQAVSPSNTPTPKPTALPTKSLTEKEQIIAYIVEVFGEDAPDAFNVLYCENRGLNPNATNHNRNGTIDQGIFQINTVHKQEDMFNWKKNIDYAYKIFSKQGWRPWTCAYRIGEKNYLDYMED